MVCIALIIRTIHNAGVSWHIDAGRACVAPVSARLWRAPRLRPAVVRVRCVPGVWVEAAGCDVCGGRAGERDHQERETRAAEDPGYYSHGFFDFPKPLDPVITSMGL